MDDHEKSASKKRALARILRVSTIMHWKNSDIIDQIYGSIIEEFKDHSNVDRNVVLEKLKHHPYDSDDSIVSSVEDFNSKTLNTPLIRVTTQEETASTTAT